MYWCFIVGGPSEREYMEKLNKIKEKIGKKAKDIRGEFEKIEKAKVDLLKKTKETKHDIERETLKMEEEITKSKDLAPESKKRLRTEIDVVKSEIRRQYAELETQIAKTITTT
ncbi:MAG: hypothetical protein QXX51_08100 [Candidatus Bathyarchaeia archaeon]